MLARIFLASANLVLPPWQGKASLVWWGKIRLIENQIDPNFASWRHKREIHLDRDQFMRYVTTCTGVQPVYISHQDDSTWLKEGSSATFNFHLQHIPHEEDVSTWLKEDSSATSTSTVPPPAHPASPVHLLETAHTDLPPHSSVLVNFLYRTVLKHSESISFHIGNQICVS